MLSRVVLNTKRSAWQAATIADQRQVDCQFTTNDAWIKLRRLYPHGPNGDGY